MYAKPLIRKVKCPECDGAGRIPIGLVRTPRGKMQGQKPCICKDGKILVKVLAWRW